MLSPKVNVHYYYHLSCTCNEILLLDLITSFNVIKIKINYTPQYNWWNNWYMPSVATAITADFANLPNKIARITEKIWVCRESQKPRGLLPTLVSRTHFGCAIWAAMIVASIAAQISQPQQVLLTNVSKRHLSLWLFLHSQFFSVILAILFGKLAKSAAIAAVTLYIPLKGRVPCHATQWPTPPSHLYSWVEHQSYEFVDASMITNKTIWLRPVLHYQKVCNKTLTMSCHFVPCDRPIKYGCRNLWLCWHSGMMLKCLP